MAVAAAGAKAGLMLFEVRRAAAAVAEVLQDDADPVQEMYAAPTAPEPTYDRPVAPQQAAPTSAVFVPNGNGLAHQADGVADALAAGPPQVVAEPASYERPAPEPEALHAVPAAVNGVWSPYSGAPSAS